MGIVRPLPWGHLSFDKLVGTRNVSRSVPKRGARSPQLPSRVLSWLLVPSVGVAFVAGAFWAVSGMLAVDRSLASSPDQFSQTVSIKHDAVSGKAEFAVAALGSTGHAGKVSREVDLISGQVQPQATDGAKGGRIALENPQQDAAPASPSLSQRFEDVAKQAAVSPEKMAALFADAAAKRKSTRMAAKKLAAPAPERFASLQPQASSALLGYADPSQGDSPAALAALSAVAPLEDSMSDMGEPEAGEDAVAAVPGFENTPDAAPLPLGRPRVKKAEKPAVEAQEELAIAMQPDKPKPAKEKEVKVAFAKPNNPAEEKSGGLLSNLFKPGKPKAGNGVAVYDISAAKVYMPDGTVLEAHSGIGKMADNPNYVHVKMNGPTPPHTYNLRMREKRFHGVEAIRMTPVGDDPMHGRTGILAHSYLLRGRAGQSHGCVAFKDYQRFLKAFKAGHVTHMIVVPGNGGGSRKQSVASNEV